MRLKLRELLAPGEFLDFVVDHEWSVVRPASVVTQRAIYDGLTCRLSKYRCCHLIVDPPSGIVVESLAAHRPPGVRSRNVADQLPMHIDPAEFTKESIEVGALFWQESGLLDVAFPVLDVEFGVPHVQIPRDYRVVSGRGQFSESDAHLIEEPILVVLARGADFARMHVDRNHSQRVSVG